MDLTNGRGLSSGRPKAVALVALVALLVAVFGAGQLVVASRTSQAQVAPSLSIKPTSGIVGSNFTLIPANFDGVCDRTSKVTYVWNFSSAAKITLTTSASLTAPFATKVPKGPDAVYPIEATCINANGSPVTAATTRFDVTGQGTTTTTTTLPTTTTTTRPTTTTTTKKGTTTTTAKKGSPTTSTVPGQTTTSTAPGSSSSTTSTTTKPGQKGKPHKKVIVVLPSPGDNPSSTSTSYLKLDALAISPGSSVTATGHGCDSDSQVTMTIGSTQVGETTADTDGSFHAPLHLGSLAVGRYDVQAECGPVLTAALDVVLASKVDPGTSTTMVVIVFFILIGLLVFRRQLFPRKAPSTEGGPTPPDEDLEP